MYIVKKLCMPSGICRRKSTTNHAMNATSAAPIDQRPSQIRCGRARMNRKKTVSRLRSRFSMTRMRTGMSGRVAKRLPQVETGQRSLRPPGLSDRFHLLRVRQRVEVVVDLDRLADAEVADRQDVAPAEVEHQEHVDGPAAEALDCDQRVVHLLVRELRQLVDRQLAVDDVLC